MHLSAMRRLVGLCRHLRTVADAPRPRMESVVSVVEESESSCCGGVDGVEVAGEAAGEATEEEGCVIVVDGRRELEVKDEWRISN